MVALPSSVTLSLNDKSLFMWPVTFMFMVTLVTAVGLLTVWLEKEILSSGPRPASTRVAVRWLSQVLPASREIRFMPLPPSIRVSSSSQCM
ncbi:hypothetical protein D3C78_1758490 [compost metagenome]